MMVSYRSGLGYVLIGWVLVCSLISCLGCGGGEAPRPGTSVVIDDAGDEAGAPAARDLNIILVTIDTLRADRVSCYGSDRVDTPVLDRFASEGVRFSNAASTVPFTLPAHTSILTGLYPPGHGVRENVGYTVGEELTTIAEVLAGDGWSTAAFVSSFVLDSRWGIAQGFDHYADDFDLSTFETTPNLSAVQRSGDETIASTVAWIDDRPDNQPFFIWLHLYDPHDPYEPPEPWASRYPGRPYEGEVAYTDSLLGGFRAELEARGLLENSLVVLTADHGEGLGDHGEASHGFFIYDTTIHVPLIIRTPDGAAKGSVVDTAVSHVDLYPTILDAAGLDGPTAVHGRSLMPFVEGAAPDWDREVYSESLYPLLHYGWAPLRSVRTDAAKLISAPRPELYDHRADTGEEVDLSAVQPALLEAMEDRLEGLRSLIEDDTSAAESSPDLDPQTLAQLQALGYAAGQGGVSLDDEDERPRADPKDRIGIHRTVMRAQTQMQNDRNAAQKALLRVLEIDGGVLDAHQMLGQLAVMDAEYETALGHFRRALELEPEHRNSLQGMAASYRALGRVEDALVGYRRLLEIVGVDTGASLAIADLEFESGQLDLAIDTLGKAVLTSEAPGLLYNKMGEVRAEQGRSAEAATLFEQAIADNGAFAVPYFNLAVLYEDRGDARRAVEHYEKAIELAPSYYRAQFNLGLMMGRLGDVDRQKALWEASIEANPSFVEGHTYLAKSLMDTGGDIERAETLVRQAIEIDPEGETGPLAYYLLADILNRTGRVAEANAAVAQGREIQAGMH